MVELARRHNLLILADEIYDKLIIDEDCEHISIATLAPDLPVITFNGLSKAYLVPGWRIGWAVATGPAEALGDYLEAVYKLLRARLSAPHPFMHAIAPALQGPQDHLKVVRAKLRRRRDLTVEWAERTPRVSMVAPRGAFYAFPKLDIPEDDIHFVTEPAPGETCAVRPRRGLRAAPGHASHANRLSAAGRSAQRRPTTPSPNSSHSAIETRVQPCHPRRAGGIVCCEVAISAHPAFPIRCLINSAHEV